MWRSADQAIHDLAIQQRTEGVVLVVGPDRGSATALVGNTRREALRLFLEHPGYDYEYLGWHNRDIADWTELGDYRKGARVKCLYLP